MFYDYINRNFTYATFSLDKSTALNYLIIGTLIYYLVKGILFLGWWQLLVNMEEKGKERIAKQKEAIQKMRDTSSISKA